MARAGAARGEAGEAAALAALPEKERGRFARLGLPDPDTVVSGDDVAAFLARAVPRAIRNRALRSLWRSNPVLACVDGLNDYDGDFTGDELRGKALRTTSRSARVWRGTWNTSRRRDPKRMPGPYPTGTVGLMRRKSLTRKGLPRTLTSWNARARNPWRRRSRLR